jgi:hypothetical protein
VSTSRRHLSLAKFISTNICSEGKAERPVGNMVDIILGGGCEILRSKRVSGHCSDEIAMDVHSFSWVKTKQFLVEIKSNKSEHYVEPEETPKNIYNMLQGFEV